MKSVFHQSDTRGHANHGWLDARHSFSFANYQDRTRMHFGVLRVLNDDMVSAQKGFGMHPHDNMEIITIPLEGQILHKDDMGNSEVIKHGDVQVMSAGTGIVHSEFNNGDVPLKLLQIWVFPNKRNVKPRYQQITLDVKDRINQFQQVVSPNEQDAGVWIHQDAWFMLGNFEKDKALNYKINKAGNGVYAFVIKGSASINHQTLQTRDGFGIWEVEKLDIQILENNTEILLIEVPMELPN